MPQHSKIITLKKAYHCRQTVVLLRFDYDVESADRVTQIEGARWSQTMKCWYIPEQKFEVIRDQCIN